ncbi:MAG: hypothetical protein APF76_16520 [Desulfitibacter sp. BRH_c19]|nr:MAG: hypothetical protein APF76_16520 [Desulfitibacter sp. BRH_c19]
MFRNKILLLSIVIFLSILAAISLWTNTQADAEMVAHENNSVTEDEPQEDNREFPTTDETTWDDNSKIDEQPFTEEKPIEPVDLETNTEQVIALSDLNDILILVNKTFKLPSDYTPGDLTVPDVKFSFAGSHEKQNMREVAARALEELFIAAEDEGTYLYAVSGFRSYSLQQSVYKGHVKRLGQAGADKISARPGHSEHQTGLAMDVTSESVEFSLSKSFGDTIEGKWVAENAHKYGFVIRYEKGKEDITGYSYEPWHLRYVGMDTALEIFENNLTLEAYLANQGIGAL